MGKKKVLLVTASYIARGGVESFLNNWIGQAPQGVSFTWYHPCRSLDKSCEEKFKEKGVVIVCGNSDHTDERFAKAVKFIKLNRDVKKLLKQSAFDIVHVNTGSSVVEAIVLRQAKKLGVPVRIAHSHSASALLKRRFYMRWVSVILKAIINHYATVKAACSCEAAESLFGVRGAINAIIVNNAIWTDKYAFSHEIREIKRRELEVDDDFVLGHVARLSPEKNQKFLIDIFSQLHKKEEASKLIIVGEGDLDSELKEYAVQSGLEDAVIFAGATDDTSVFYSAMDVFVLPSLYEGLPIVGIEAQASGLPCFFSTCVTEKVMLTNGCCFLSLDKSAEKWADEILNFKGYTQEKRYNAHCIVDDRGFGMSHLRKMMRVLYGEDIYSASEGNSK